MLRPNAIPNLLIKRKADREKRDVTKEVIAFNYIHLESHNNTETINADIEVTNTEATNTEITSTEATNTEAINTEITSTEATNTEATNTEITSAKATNTETTNNISRNTTNNTISEKEQIKHLQITLKKTLRHLKRKLKRQDVQFEKVFTKDQLKFIAKNTQRGASWSTETINKALRLYVSCGQKGYEEMRRQNLPYPSIQTIQHHIQGLKCKPGILQNFLHVLKIKIQTFNWKEKHAVLILDEMSIKSGLQYDHSIASVVGRPTALICEQHILLFLCCAAFPLSGNKL